MCVIRAVNDIGLKRKIFGGEMAIAPVSVFLRSGAVQSQFDSDVFGRSDLMSRERMVMDRPLLMIPIVRLLVAADIVRPVSFRWPMIFQFLQHGRVLFQKFLNQPRAVRRHGRRRRRARSLNCGYFRMIPQHFGRSPAVASLLLLFGNSGRIDRPRPDIPERRFIVRLVGRRRRRREISRSLLYARTTV